MHASSTPSVPAEAATSETPNSVFSGVLADTVNVILTAVRSGSRLAYKVKRDSNLS